MVEYQQENDDGGFGGGGECAIVAPQVIKPMVVRPQAVKPQVVRPTAMRPSADMLARIAQDFEANPPPAYEQEEQPPLTSIEIRNVPCPSTLQKNSNNNMEDDQSDVTMSTTATSRSKMQSNDFAVDATPNVKEAKKRLKARRTMSSTNFNVDTVQLLDQEDQDQDHANTSMAPALDLVGPPQGLSLVKPMAVRPTPIRPTPVRPKPHRSSRDKEHKKDKKERKEKRRHKTRRTMSENNLIYLPDAVATYLHSTSRIFSAGVLLFLGFVD